MTCRAGSRSARAAEGATMGAIVGALSGLIMGGVLRVGAKNSKVPLIAGFGIFGLSIIGNAIYEAAPPECHFTRRA